MSGGSLSYFYLHLQEHIGDFHDKELDDLVKDFADLFYAREWYLSSDTCKDDWIEARNKFKKKWFTEQGHKERIEKYLSEFISEIKEAFGIDTQPSAQQSMTATSNTVASDTVKIPVMDGTTERLPSAQPEPYREDEK